MSCDGVIDCFCFVAKIFEVSMLQSSSSSFSTLTEAFSTLFTTECIVCEIPTSTIFHFIFIFIFFMVWYSNYILYFPLVFATQFI